MKNIHRFHGKFGNFGSINFELLRTICLKRKSNNFRWFRKCWCLDGRNAAGRVGEMQV